MLFEDREKETMALKEIPVTFKCGEQFRGWLGRKATKLDLSISETVRAALLLAVPQMESIRGVARIDLEDMRVEEKKR